MGLDGFSISDLRMRNELTSAQMSNNAERLAREGSEFQIKDVDGMAKDAEIRRKEESEKQEQQKKKKQGENFEDYFEETDEEDKSLPQKQQAEDEKDFVDPFKNKNVGDFAVRINPKTEMIELYNKKDKKVMETISADELMMLITKMSCASGILVNKKI